MLGRIIEPTSKADTLRVLSDIGVEGPSLRTVFRALARCIDRNYRGGVATACLAHSAKTPAGQASLVLYDCTTLYFESEKEDQLRKVGMSKDTGEPADPDRAHGRRRRLPAGGALL